MIQHMDHHVGSGPQEYGPANPMRVLLVDDHGPYRAELVKALGSKAGFELVGEAADGLSALQMIDDLSPDVVVLDVKMPGMTGFEVCSRLVDAGSHTRVLLLTAYLDEGLIGHARGLGAAGYLGKEATMREVCNAVWCVGEGGTAFATAG
jgi:DNA-binding NarL/FixJ family response regulator